MDDDFWNPRRCFREPIDEIFQAASLLDDAVGAHLAADYSSASALFQTADMPAIRAFTESLWGSKKANPEQQEYLRIRKIVGARSYVPKKERHPVRMPTAIEKLALIEQWGRHCVFCGIPLIRSEVRRLITRAYSKDAPWGRTNRECHAALQCMWMQFDHVLPHSRGGDSSLTNTVVTCAPCNFGRWHRTLEEVGLIDPRLRPVKKTSWGGLERFLQKPKRPVENAA
jgi:5-methylcytosine-specific restriction endonuclease McrA